MVNAQLPIPTTIRKIVAMNVGGRAVQSQACETTVPKARGLSCSEIVVKLN